MDQSFLTTDGDAQVVLSALSPKPCRYCLRLIYLLACTGIVFCPATVRAIDRITKTNGFNGPINVISEPDKNGTRYLGGDFTAYGQWDTGGGAVVNLFDGSADPSFPRVNGVVYASVADGVGGFFIGGAFDSVDGQPRRNAAHIAADGLVDSWAPDPNGAVRAMARLGSTVYLGGSFTRLKDVERNFAGAVSVSGAVDDIWKPSMNNTVYALAVVDSKVYLGGDFTEVSGETRGRLAAVSTSGELDTSWTPSVNNTVRAISSGTVLTDTGTMSVTYFGGDFTEVNGTTRNHVAALGPDAELHYWDPDVNGPVFCLAVRPEINGVVLIGGSFTQVGGVLRNNLAMIYYGGGSSVGVGSWSPNPNGPVLALQLEDEYEVFLGGDFTRIGDTSRSYAAKLFNFFDEVTVSPWRPDTDGPVFSLAREIKDQQKMYLGGSFSGVRAELRPFAAAINSDGTLHPWSPQLESSGLDGPGGVDAILVSEETVFLGGRFTSVNGEARQGVAALNSGGFLNVLFRPVISGGRVESIAAIGNRVYLGGSFTQVDEYARKSLVALFRDNGGVDLTWDVQIDGERVSALAASGSTLFLGGIFSAARGAVRGNLAAVTAQGEILPWEPAANGRILALTVADSRVYIGGLFSRVNGLPRGNAVAVDFDGGVSDSWRPRFDDEVRTIRVSPSLIYLGGNFTEVEGASRNFIAAVSPEGTISPEWRPILNGPVSALSLSSSAIFVGGAFTKGGTSEADYLALLDPVAGSIIPVPEQTPTPVPTSTPTPTPTATSIPIPAPKKPVVNWAPSSAQRFVRAFVSRVRGVSYAISGTAKGRARKGRCAPDRAISRIVCTVKLSKGTWVVAVTPIKQGVAGRSARKRFTFAR